MQSKDKTRLYNETVIEKIQGQLPHKQVQRIYENLNSKHYIMALK